MADLVLLDIDDRGVATITLNRPERLNAINMAMRDLLWEYLQACRDHPGRARGVFPGRRALVQRWGGHLGVRDGAEPVGGAASAT